MEYGFELKRKYSKKVIKMFIEPCNGVFAHKAKVE